MPTVIPLREHSPELVVWATHCLAPDNPYRVVGDQLYAKFHQHSAADLAIFPTPEGFIPLDLAWVLAFQTMERLAPAATAHALVARLDWKYALHLPLDHPGCTARELKTFRKRLLIASPSRAPIIHAMLARLGVPLPFP